VALAWPTSTLPFRDVMFARRNLSRSGGLTITGIEQVVQSASDFWAATVHLGKIHSGSQILAYRALQAQNWGRAGEWIIPVCSSYGLPSELAAPDYSFSDDWSADFSIGPPPTTIPPAGGGLTTVLAARGARSITVGFEDPLMVPLPGMYFSIGNYLYVVATATSVGVRLYTITFAPGLRIAAPIETVVEFASPRCLMRLAQDNIGDLTLEQLRFSDITLNFVEVPA
jgi:hypothetical protein